MVMNRRGINFYLSRLRQASLPELVHRAVEAFFIKRVRKLVKTKKLSLTIPDMPADTIESLRLPMLEMNVDETQLQAIMNGKRFTLNADEAAIHSFENMWKDSFSCDIKPDESADIRAAWEPARLQNVAALLAMTAKGNSGDEAPVNHPHETAKLMAKNTVLGWLNANPFLFGPHYMSAMECGLRIPVFFYCLKGDKIDGAQRLRLLTAIYEHAWWVSHRSSLYSSLGNHTIAEAVGLVFAGSIFKSTKEGKAWLDRGYGLLKQELTHQILDDGGPAEQSLSYHRFVLDLYWLAVDLLEKNDLADCSAWKPRLIEGEKFLKAFTDALGNLPSIGDSDDGNAIASGVHPKRENDDFVESRPYINFPESGYTVIRAVNWFVLTFDHGPLGMAPLYNHGHADALSVNLSLAGEQILVDPGTYRYNGVPEWRRYFKGTRAHNTVTIDGEDQAIQKTGFIWSHPYNANLIRISGDSGTPHIEATHDGYTRLPEPVTHRRVVDFCSDSLLFIKDSFSGKGMHTFELNFHIHPDATLIWNDTYSVIKKGEAALSIVLLGGKRFCTACGQTTPPFGWYSPEYGVKVQSSVLSCKVYGASEQVSFVTAVSLDQSAPDINELEKIACRR